MKKHFIELIMMGLVILLTCVHLTASWNLSVLGLNEARKLVKHVTILKNRAYLSIPRQSRSQIMTLVEASWTERVPSFEPRLFPSLNLQKLGDCDSLQSVICSDVDVEGQLYVLDMGYEYCPPKIITYNGVTQKKITGFTCDLLHVDGSSLNTIVVDSFSKAGPQAYVGYGANEGLIVYNVRKHDWWFIKLAPPTELIDFHPYKFLLEPQYMALSKNKSTLYFTYNNTNYLFSINLEILRSLPVPEDKYLGNIDREVATINVDLVGEKLGPSKGLICDEFDGLYYFVPRFYALVRWDTRQPFVAEHHQVVMQSSVSLPQVEQIIVDFRTVWALLGLPNKKDNYCVKVLRL